jgi:uncharacterized protein YdaT
MSWLPGFLQSEKYPKLHLIVNNSDAVNKELDELNQNYPIQTSKIKNLYNNINSELTRLFDIIKQNEEKQKQQQTQTQTGGRRTKKSRHSKKSQKTRKSRK